MKKTRWIAAMVAVGLVIMGPFNGADGENSVNKSLEAARTSTWNSITHVMSSAGNTEYVIGLAAISAGVLFWRTRRW